jgi:hypothetical protein
MPYPCLPWFPCCSPSLQFFARSLLRAADVHRGAGCEYTLVSPLTDDYTSLPRISGSAARSSRLSASSSPCVWLRCPAPPCWLAMPFADCHTCRVSFCHPPSFPS